MPAQLPRRTLLASSAVAASAPLLAACGDDTPDTARARAEDRREDSHEADPVGGDVLITNVLVFDGERFAEHDSVLVRGGLITEVGHDLAAPGVPEFDGNGRVLLPGLIDAHAHRSGSNAGAGLRFGVTAMLDMYGEIDSRIGGRESLGQREHADVWWAGWGLTVPDGHPTQWFPAAPTVSDASEVDAFVAERVAEGSDFLKLLIQGQGPPTSLNQEQTTAGVEAAHARGMLAVAHVGSWEDAVIAARAGVDALVHLPYRDSPNQEALDLFAERGTPVVATLTVSPTGRCEHDAAAFLDDPAIADRLDGGQRTEIATSLRDYCETVDIGHSRDMIAASFAAVRDAGLPVLVGTDNGNPPVVTGVSMYHEMAMFAEHGMSTEEILAGATSMTADVFGLDERGRIAAGKRADLVLIDATKPDDVIGSYGIESVWKNGHPVDLEP